MNNANSREEQTAKTPRKLRDTESCGARSKRCDGGWRSTHHWRIWGPSSARRRVGKALAGILTERAAGPRCRI